jgi:hypothetical protein
MVDQLACYQTTSHATANSLMTKAARTTTGRPAIGRSTYVIGPAPRVQTETSLAVLQPASKSMVLR